MNVVILAAGRGRRFDAEGGLGPKCLQQVAGQPPLLEMNLARLLRLPRVGRVVIVTGHAADAVERFLQRRYPSEPRIVAAFNPRFADSVIGSVRIGFAAAASGPLLLLNGDTVFSSRIFELAEGAARTENGVILFGTETGGGYPDDIRVVVRDGRVRDVCKSLTAGSAASAGAVFLGREGRSRYEEILFSAEADAFTTHHRILRSLALALSGPGVGFVDLGARSWLEVDRAADLQREIDFD